jgi:aerobic-type carbon monoxide dehydrogenase small subunit (CoxS/CutS family)
MITLPIKGQEHTTDADPSLPMLGFLRDELNLTGCRRCPRPALIRRERAERVL